MVTIPQHLSPSCKPTAFPVWHASIQGISGCVVRLGGVTYFSPVEDPAIYVLSDLSQLIVTSELAEPIASFVRTEIEQKLQSHFQGAIVMEGVA
jgi:hypothetical protein